MLNGYRTIASASVALIASGAQLLGYSVPIGDIEGAVNAAIALGASLAAIYYRRQAGKP